MDFFFIRELDICTFFEDGKPRSFCCNYFSVDLAILYPSERTTSLSLERADDSKI